MPVCGLMAHKYYNPSHGQLVNIRTYVIGGRTVLHV